MALTDNLIAAWNMDGDSSDATGNGNNGTDTMMSYSSTNAVIDEAGQFGGASFIKVSPTNFASTTAVTITAWVYNTANWTGVQTIVGKSNAAGSAFMRLNVESGVVNATTDSAGHVITGGTTLSLNTRYFLAVTYSTSSQHLNLYVNGATDAAQQTFNAALTPSTDNVGIGILGDFAGLQLFAGGAIDIVNWWDRELSSAEITQLYNGGSGLQYPFTATSDIKTINGVTYANTKTVQGVAIASVKSINGVV